MAPTAINSGDPVDIPGLVHPEVVFEPLRSGTEGPFVGHEGMRRFIADTEDMFEIFEPSYPEVRDLGDCLVAIGSISIRARGSGVEVDVPSAAVVEYRDGLLWRYKDYGDARAARRRRLRGRVGAYCGACGPRWRSGAARRLLRGGGAARLARGQGGARRRRSPARSTPC